MSLLRATFLPYRRRVLQAALGPQRVKTAFDLEWRVFAHVAFEHLAIVADVLDDTHYPVLGEPELFAVIALGVDQLLDVRFSDMTASSMFFEVTPASSALSMA